MNRYARWTRLLAAGALAAGGFLAQAEAATAVYVNIAPPAPVYEAVPLAQPGRVWVAGHYEWHGHRYVWRPGYWVVARAGYEWRPAQWVQAGSRWSYEPGTWIVVQRGPVHHGHGGPDYGHRDSDHDGVPNRFDRRPHDPYRR